MSVEVKRRKGEAHSEEDIERALTAYAFHGSLRRASRACGISWSSIATLKDNHPERLEEIKGRLHERLAEQSESLAHRYAELQHQTLDEFDPSKLEQRERPRAAKDLNVAMAVSVDKAAMLRGLPTQIIEHRDGTALLRKLGSIGLIVEGSAAEVEPGAVLAADGLATDVEAQPNTREDSAPD